MLIDRIFAEAEPILAERKIDEVMIGLTIAAVSFDDGSIGTALILHEEMANLSEVVFAPEEIKGMPAIDLAKWAIDPTEHPLKRTLGIATINACATALGLPNTGGVDASKAVEVYSSDTVGVIGYIRSLVSKMEDKAKKVIVYDNGEEENVYPSETQEILLPSCDIVYITGTTFVNHSIDHLLDLCKNAREIIVVGPTTPMFPNAYKDTNVKLIAGGIWKKDCKKEIFARVALNAGIPTLSKYMHKQSVRIND